jgi:hypothetical protein
LGQGVQASGLVLEQQHQRHPHGLRRLALIWAVYPPKRGKVKPAEARLLE